MNIPDSILRIAGNLHAQDNLATSYPVFMVQRLVRTYGMQENYSDSFYWVDHDWNPCDPDEKGATKLFYLEHWENVQACFTQVGAEEYIKSNGHNLIGGDNISPRIYVESGWRNEEWAEIREFLMGLGKST